MNVYIKTYGCQMNERDSESAAAMLVSAGHRIAGTEEEADIVILNTCSVREQAERKAIGKLGILKKLKRERPHMIFGIMGCMAQSRGEELLKSVEHLDFAVGTDNIHAIPEIVEEIVRKKRKIRCDDRRGADTPGIDAHRINAEQGQFSAFLSISRGCNRYCSYCIVPYVRGPERSRDMDGIVAEARSLADHGIREIMLLGQNVAAYGLDGVPPPIAEDNSPFSELLERISAIDGIRRIRFTSPHPAFFNRKLIETIARLPKVCKCIHLPLQSGSDRILQRMNRPSAAEHYMTIIRSLRELVEGINVSTDIIVGFPGETEEDFEATRRIMREAAYDNAFIFKYSPRRGTVAAKMPDDVPQEEKERRNALLLRDLAEINASRNRELVGKTFEVLAEGPSKRNAARWSGRTDTFKLAVFPPSPGLKPGDFVRVRIERATPMTLYGSIEG